MTITPYDSQNNLFVVDDFYPDELIEQFVSTDHLSAAWKKEDWQEHYPRRRLMHEPGSIYERMNSYVNSQLAAVAEAISMELIYSETGFWLDEPGFRMLPHIDNEGVAVSLQIYLNQNNNDLGTIFYNPDKTVRHCFEYKLNTGYLMINGPAQLHGMGVAIPEGTYRISSYSWFYPKV